MLRMTKTMLKKKKRPTWHVGNGAYYASYNPDNIGQVRHIVYNNQLSNFSRKPYILKDKDCGQKILCCIINHNNNENAERWLDLLSKRFDTIVIDSGSDIKNSRFELYDNVYYGGAYNIASKKTIDDNYDWMLIVCSDVEIEDVYCEKLLEHIDDFRTTTNVGIYCPSLNKKSADYWSNFNNGTNTYSTTFVVNGFFSLIKSNIVKEAIDGIANMKYGQGIDIYSSILSRDSGYLNIIDNSVEIYHPFGTGYSEKDARNELLNLLKNLNIKPSDSTLNKSIQNIDEIKFANKEQIIVTLTSWKKRIKNIPSVLNSVLENTLKPNKIILNLSIEEFENKEEDLPSDVVSFVKEHNDIIEIFWVNGPNYKNWKKTIPTLKRFPNDCIINIDDDWIYPNDMIEHLYMAHLDNPNNPISGNKFTYKGIHCQCGCASLIKLEFLDNIFDYATDEIMKMNSDDIFFTYVAARCGHPFVFCGKEFFTNMQSFNPISPVDLGTSDPCGTMWNHLVKKYGECKNI